MVVTNRSTKFLSNGVHFCGASKQVYNKFEAKRWFSLLSGARCKTVWVSFASDEFSTHKNIISLIVGSLYSTIFVLGILHFFLGRVHIL